MVNSTRRIKKIRFSKQELLSFMLIELVLWGGNYAYIISIMLAAYFMLVYGIRIGKKFEIKYFDCFLLPNILIFLHALVAAYFNGESFFLSRSLSNLVYSCSIVIIASYLWMAHKGRVLHVFTVAIIVKYIICIGQAFIYAGPATFFGAILNPGSDVLDRWLESHDIGLSCGFLIIYWLFFGFKKNNRSFFAAIFVIFLLCFKRIAVGAVVVTVLFYYLNRRVDKKNRLMLVFGIGGMLLCFLYIVLVRNEEILGWFARNNISTMGRASLYRKFYDYYYISPSFFGRGSGFAAKTLPLMGSLLGGLHSDILRVYIELGFIGSLLWYGYYLLYLPLKFKKINLRLGDAFFGLTIYAFIIYLTDNTTNYFLFQLLYMSIPLVVYKNDKVITD